MATEPIEIVSAIDARKTGSKVGRDGLGYIWEIADNPIVLRIDYLNSRAEELTGEIEITHLDQHLHMERFCLTDGRERAALVKSLELRTMGHEIPWSRYIEQFCVAVLRREREGSQTEYTSPAERQRTEYVVDQLCIKHKTNTLFAPGGHGKGYLSCAICCAVAAKRGLGDLTVMDAIPGYLDWEDDFRTFNDRINAVARGMQIDIPRIPYRRMRGLISNRINEIARWISDEGLDFVVVDSFSAAGGTVDQKTSWDTVAHRFFDALDLVPDVTWFIIDHVTGEALKAPVGKAFGSIQKSNRVRNGWEMRTAQEPGSKISHMRIYDAKWNHTGHRPALGIRMEFTDDDVLFESEEPIEPGDGSNNLPARMVSYIERNGPQNVRDLARELGVEEGSVRMALSRDSREGLMARRFRRAKDSTKIALIGEEPKAIVHSSADDEPLPWR